MARTRRFRPRIRAGSVRLRRSRSRPPTCRAPPRPGRARATRSGSFANATRPATTVRPNTGSTTLQVSMPTARASSTQRPGIARASQPPPGDHPDLLEQLRRDCILSDPQLPQQHRPEVRNRGSGEICADAPPTDEHSTGPVGRKIHAAKQAANRGPDQAATPAGSGCRLFVRWLRRGGR